MWETLEKDIKNTCHDCRWIATTACPYSEEFVGRRLFDTDGPDMRKICHRFILREDVREARWQATMDKLHENLIPEEDTDDFPF